MAKQRAKQRAKKSKEDIASARKTRVIKARHVAYICAEINSRRLPSGRLRRGELEKALKEHKPVVPWITIDLIKKGLNKDSIESTTTITTTISDLTDGTASSPDTDISPTSDVDPNNAPLPPVTITAVELASNGTGTTSKKGGRPRGTTMKAKREKSLKEEALVNEIATEWTKVKQEDRTANHTLESLITRRRKSMVLRTPRLPRIAFESE